MSKSGSIPSVSQIAWKVNGPSLLRSKIHHSPGRTFGARLLMGGILSVAMVGFVPMVYAQAGGGGAGGGAAGGASGGAMGGSEGMGASDGAPGTESGMGSGSSGSTMGQPSNPNPNGPGTVGAPDSSMGGSSTGGSTWTTWAFQYGTLSPGGE